MEAMAVESLVAALWELEGFLTKVRQPVRMDRGYSDIDVIGVNSLGDVRICECKATGKNSQVYEFGKNFDEFIGHSNGHQKSWDNFLNVIPRLYEEGQKPAWLPLRHGAQKTLEIWFVSNSWCVNEATRNLAEQSFWHRIKQKFPEAVSQNATTFRVKIRSTADIIFDAIAGVRVAGLESGRRFGHPVLDTFRELVRFSNPTLGNVIDGDADMVRRETESKLLEALGLGTNAEGEA